MSKYDSVYELASHADNEGGFTSFLYGYGLALEDLPDDTPEWVVGDIEKLLAVEPLIWNVRIWLDKALQAGDPEADDESRVEH